jgi:hypothetical protein
MKHIKVTNEDRTLFKEMTKKHGIVKENRFFMNILNKVMGYQIQKALKNNKELQSAIKDADEALTKAKADVQDYIDKGYELTPYMKQWAKSVGLDINKKSK